MYKNPYSPIFTSKNYLGKVLKSRFGLLYIFVSVSSLLLFVVSIIGGHNFISDDIFLLHAALDNPFPISRIFYLEGEELYRPVVYLSLYFNYLVSGYSPWSYYLLNTILHAANVLILYLLVYRLFRGYQSRLHGLPETIALIFSALFMFYPQNLMNVFWISGRTDLLASLFLFSSLWFFWRFIDTRQLLFGIAGFFLLLASALSKETWLVFYIYMFLIVIKEHKKPGIGKAVFLSSLYLLPGILYMGLRSGAAGLTSSNLESAGSFVKFWIYGVLSLFIPADFLEVYNLFFVSPVLFYVIAVTVVIASVSIIIMFIKSGRKKEVSLLACASVIGLGIYLASFPQMRLMYIHLPLLIAAVLFLVFSASSKNLKKIFTVSFLLLFIAGDFYAFHNFAKASAYSEKVFGSVPQNPEEKNYIYPVLIMRFGQTWCLPDIKKLATFRSTGSLEGKPDERFTHLVELSTYSSGGMEKIDIDSSENKTIISLQDKTSLLSLPEYINYDSLAVITPLARNRYRGKYFDKIAIEYKSDKDSIIIPVKKPHNSK